MRIVGLETEFALGFRPARPGGTRPPQETLFKALLRALKLRLRSCEALYYKGGEFLQDGSLIHFEISRLDDPRVGLLEWATPECLGALEAATYAKAQEAALATAVVEAEADLLDQGFEGRLFLLKNNEDRYGNAYGCHESYDVCERPLPFSAHVMRWVLHPLVLLGLLTLALTLALPFVLLFVALGVLLVAFQVLAVVPGLGLLGGWLQDRLRAFMEYLVEVSPTPGSGLVAHSSLLFLRFGGAIFSFTASRTLFTQHMPALLGFLATRPLLGGAGSLDPDGVYSLTPRAKLMKKTVAAFIYGTWRPMVDIKEFFYRRPLGYLRPRLRLHVLAGDSNRSEYAELLTLATTEAVLDAIEAGALDALAERLEFKGGALDAFKTTASDPTLRATVARDLRTGDLLTALDVQRRYLEAVWAHERSSSQVSAERKDTLIRWNFVLDRLADDPRTLDRELDWVMKLKLLQAAIHDSLADADGDGAWETLQAWGAVNRLLERVAPHLEFAGQPTSEAVRRSMRGALGLFSFRKADRHVRRAGLDWEAFAPVRRAYLRLKTIDLKYHEISVEGGYYDWIAQDGGVTRVLDPLRVARAEREPPLRTRATIRGQTVQRYAEDEDCELRVGWDKLVFDRGELEPRVVHLDDPYQHEL